MIEPQPLDLDALEADARSFRPIPYKTLVCLIERLRDKEESVEAAFRFFIDICGILGVNPDDTEPDEVPTLIEALGERLRALEKEDSNQVLYWTARAEAAESQDVQTLMDSVLREQKRAEAAEAKVAVLSGALQAIRTHTLPGSPSDKMITIALGGQP